MQIVCVLVVKGSNSPWRQGSSVARWQGKDAETATASSLVKAVTPRDINELVACYMAAVG